MPTDSNATQTPTPRRFVSIARTVHPSGNGYFLDAVADDGTAWYILYHLDRSSQAWKQHRTLPPIS